MHGLGEFYGKCHREKTTLLLSGVNSHVFKSLRKYGLVDLIGKENIFDHIDPALKHAEAINRSVEG
jgi:SulP family sulfate permease